MHFFLVVIKGLFLLIFAGFMGNKHVNRVLYNETQQRARRNQQKDMIIGTFYLESEHITDTQIH